MSSVWDLIYSITHSFNKYILGIVLHTEDRALNNIGRVPALPETFSLVAGDQCQWKNRAEAEKGTVQFMSIR